MRSSGILMHITSLPSPYGVGTLGKEAYSFIDFLKNSGQEYWQILPVGPTGYGDSPYQSFSAFAGNPYFIDLDCLEKDGLLRKEEYKDIDFGSDPERVDFEKLYNKRFKILSLACSRLEESREYLQFCKKNAYWLDDYAKYTVIKESLGGIPFTLWPDELRLGDKKAIKNICSAREEDMTVIKKTQFLFDRQWSALRAYAKKSGIKIIGDIPIYVSPDSADVFSSPDMFVLGDDNRPTEVAGCPPDAFSADGQLWGNPLYRWDKMEADGFSWWKKRLARSSELFDCVRIDHFRGFDSYYCIPTSSKTAAKGKWRKGPGMKLFDAIKDSIGALEIIAEDLGTITPSVRRLLKRSGFPGMKVLQFAFTPGEESEYLPHRHTENCVVYTGTHDNDTTKGWLSSLDEEQLKFASDYMRLSEREGEVWGVIKAAMQSPAKLCIIPMQDFINADSSARMNTPSTLGGNWTWRIADGCTNDWLARLIYNTTATYSRVGKDR